jgi:hypothetical protein
MGVYCLFILAMAFCTEQFAIGIKVYRQKNGLAAGLAVFDKVLVRNCAINPCGKGLATIGALHTEFLEYVSHGPGETAQSFH